MLLGWHQGQRKSREGQSRARQPRLWPARKRPRHGDGVLLAGVLIVQFSPQFRAGGRGEEKTMAQRCHGRCLGEGISCHHVTVRSQLEKLVL